MLSGGSSRGECVMFEAVEGLVAEHHELEGRLGDPETHADARLAKQLNRRYAELSAIIMAWRDWTTRMKKSLRTRLTVF